MSSKPTLRDIAEATGVSTASVSMILNGKSLERFSSQRVASVLAEAERIGYRTPSARCSGKQIAVLSPSVANPYHTKMIAGIDAAGHAAGYHTAIYNTYWNPRTESHLLDSLDYSRVAGIIFAMTPTQTAKVRELSRRVPIVAVGDRVTDCGIDTVDVDNFGAAQLVAKHLIDLGHKRIAYLSTALNEHHVSRMRRGEGRQLPDPAEYPRRGHGPRFGPERKITRLHRPAQLFFRHTNPPSGHKIPARFCCYSANNGYLCQRKHKSLTNINKFKTL